MASQAAEHGAPLRLSPAVAGLASAGAMLGLLVYWFAVADRYVVFLYGHVDGGIAGSPAATPFDAVTLSRYWMSGFVAAGAVSVVYIAVLAALGVVTRRRGRRLLPPAWERAWLWAVAPLAAGIPILTMTQNQPTLPADAALAVTGAALAGLALALAPGGLAAREPRELGWLAAYGLALLPTLALWRASELPTRGIMSPPTAWMVALGGVSLSALCLAALRWWRGRRGRPAPPMAAVLAGGLWWLLLFAPLVHHLVFVPPEYRYITTGANVLGFHPATPLAALAVATLLAWLATRPAREPAL